MPLLLLLLLALMGSSSCLLSPPPPRAIFCWLVLAGLDGWMLVRSLFPLISSLRPSGRGRRAHRGSVIFFRRGGYSSRACIGVAGVGGRGGGRDDETVSGTRTVADGQQAAEHLAWIEGRT